MTIKTFIIDDSVLFRKIVSEVASGFKEIEIIGTAANGEIALKKLELLPVDFILCDVYMPGKDGVETLIEIKKRFPKVVVVMMSGISSRSADITIRALEIGAIDFISKPDNGSLQQNLHQFKADFQNVLRLVTIRLAKNNNPIATLMTQKQTLESKQDKGTAPSKSISSMPKSPSTPSQFSVIAIGVSTGGPEALNHLIPALPASLSVPVLIVQHMPPQFTKSLADSLNKKSKIPVYEAEEGIEIKPGSVFIAPGGRHMIVRKTAQTVTVGLTDSPPENSCRPSVDVLFRSVAAIYGDQGILSIVLTGMGNDGLNGVRVMKRKGCFCITQSESTCVVYGMPRAIDDAGLSDLSLPLDRIAEQIRMKLNCY